MINFKYFLLLLPIAMTSAHANENEPMYGGMDRVNNPELYQQDQAFIYQATNTFGTAEHASIGYVDSGFEAHLKGKQELAMQRFNQAWLLDNNNPYSYVGFGVLYQHNKNYCKAMDMFDIASEKELVEPGFLADYAFIISQCINETKNTDKQKQLTDKVSKIYEQAEQTTNDRVKMYVYKSWVKSLLLLKQPKQALQKVEYIESLGQIFDNELKLKVQTALEQS